MPRGIETGPSEAPSDEVMVRMPYHASGFFLQIIHEADVVPADKKSDQSELDPNQVTRLLETGAHGLHTAQYQSTNRGKI